MTAFDLGTPPVEHRWLGMDRRLIWPSLLIVFWVLLLGGIIPAINEAIPADEFDPGETVTVSNQLEFNPVAGWAPDGAPLPSSPTLVIFKGGVSMSISVGGWDDTSDALLDELLDSADYYVKGDRRSFVLPSGPSGTAVEIYGVDTDGALFAIVDPTTAFELDVSASPRGIGAKVQVKGPAEELDSVVTDVAEMIASIRIVGDERDASTDGSGS